MYSHRFLQHLNRFQQPETATVQPAGGGFAWLPSLFAVSEVQQAWQFAVYQRAFAEAEAVVRRSLPERDLLAVWN